MAKSKAPPPLELDAADVPALLERVREAMSAEDYGLIQALLATLIHITELVAKKKASIQRLTKLLFGVRTEKASVLLPNAVSGAESSPEGSQPPAGKRKGHGRKRIEDYPGATRILVPHPRLTPGDACLDGCGGTLYRLKKGVRLVRFRGKAALDAVLYTLEQLRCSLCGALYTAPAPEGVGAEKYDPTAVSMLAVLRYGAGLPLHRIERLQACLDLPVASSTQWDLLNAAAGALTCVLDELLRYGAQGELFHNDDTPMKILALMGKRAEAKQRATAEADRAKKRAVFTSGMVLIREGRTIILFCTGPRHAGENLATVLAHRGGELPPPIHMCDALSRNVPKLPKTLEMILANCLTHGRRQFVDVLANFPEPCRHVIETLAPVYRNDELAKQQAMRPEERLLFHQAHSGPLMDGLQDWLLEQRDQHKVEPNSGLGQAIAYMLRHWTKLTVFLRVAGAPLDNNLCERVLKKAILHRKNSLFYKTQHGAEVGDLYMSLIATCEQNGVNPLTYLTELMRHTNELQANPAAWMPWNYTQVLGQAEQPRAGPTRTLPESPTPPAGPPRHRPARPKPPRPIPSDTDGCAPSPPAC